MARRGDPARILQAQRAGTRQRLLSTGMLPDAVDAALSAREATYGPPRDGRDLDAAFRWIEAKRKPG